MSYGYPYVGEPVPVVVSDRYVSLKPFALNTVKKWGHSWTGEFYIEDENRSCVFTAHRTSFIKKTILLQNAGGQTVLSLRCKAPGKWKAYSGSAIRDDNLLFESQRNEDSNSVYLPANTSHHQPDFTVKTNSWRTTNFKVFYMNQVIAETTTERFKHGKKKMVISGIPNIDQAFVAAILVIMEEIIREDVQAAVAEGAGAAAGAAVSAAVA